MTAPSEDAVGAAREAMVNLLRRYAEIEHPNHDHPAIARKFERDVASDLKDLDALIRAVRAECAAKVEALRTSSTNSVRNTVLDNAIAALEAP